MNFEKNEGIEKDFKAPVETKLKEVNQSESSKLFSKVNKYFNMEDDLYKHANDDIEERSELYFKERRKDLEKYIQSQREGKQTSPDEIAHSLAAALKAMETRNPHLEANNFGTQDDQAEMKSIEDRYKVSKDVFMEFCRVAYPDADSSVSGTSLRIKLIQLNRLAGRDVDNIKSPDEISDLLANNPAELAHNIDSELWEKSQSIFEKSLEDFQNNADLNYGNNQKLSNFIKTAYELQLIRDELQAKTYGNAEVSAGDASEIDAIRDQLDSNKEIKDPHLAKAKELVGFEKGFFQRYFNVNLSKLDLQDSQTDRWEKLGENLENLRKEFIADKRPMNENKQKDYQSRIDTVLGSV